MVHQDLGERFQAPIPSSSHRQDATPNSPFRLIGIAMVVDHAGEGAKMLVRYPASTLQDADDVFYRMPGRQMAKLFRPKPALCDQPMTLSIGGTVFCCCAVLMDQEVIVAPSAEVPTLQKGAERATTDPDLSLFSVIVALRPREKAVAEIPIGGWIEPGTSGNGAANNSKNHAEDGKSNTGKVKIGESFLCIRRIHISLARFCRVLKREEKRCRYISIQSRLFEEIRQEVISRHSASIDVNNLGNELDVAHISTGVSNHSPKSVPLPAPALLANTTSPPVNASPASVATKKIAKQSHKRTSSSFTLPKAEGAAIPSTAAPQASVEYSEALEQEIIETIMVAKSPGFGDKSHEGNLALEVMQVFHALGRNDHQFPPTPEQLLSDKEGLVFVNAHIAVAMEPLAASRASRFVDLIAGSNGKSVIRPYHTLLFPSASPSELLESMSATTTSSRSVAPRRLQQLLRMVNPQKSLTEIAIDTNLPIQSALEIATILVAHGACLTSPVINRKSVLSCSKINEIREFALPFSQEFGTSVHLFELVSFVTTARRTVGDLMRLLDDSDEPIVARIRRSLDTTIGSSGDDMSPRDDVRSSDNFQPMSEEQFPRAGHLDEILFQMVVWLCSHSVLEQMREYLIEITHTEEVAKDNEADENQIDADKDVIALRDEKLMQKLRDRGCLTGKISVEACCWKTDCEPSSLFELIERHPEVRLIARLPSKGDDWDAV